MTFPFPSFLLVASSPITSYANGGGTGNRSATVTVTDSSIAWDSGTSQNLVDGDTTANSGSNSADEPGTGSTAIATGQWIKFDFGVGASKFIDELKIYMRNFGVTNTRGSWDLEGSNDDSAWTPVNTSSLTWNGSSNSGAHNQSIPVPRSDAVGYRYYRFIKTAAVAGTYNNSWICEFEFKITAV